MQLVAFDSDTGAGSAIFLAVMVVLSAAIYFIPTIVARGKPCSASVFVVNLFLGWTLVGWVVALAWALKDPVQLPTAQVIQQTEPMAAPRLCSTCGKYSTPDAKFCSGCGLQL
jgi:Superinfection immunity protein